MAGGWGSGKSTAGLGFCFISALTNPPGTAGMAIQPTHQLMNEWLEMALLPAFRHVIRHHDIGRRCIHLPGNRRLLYRSGHKPERLQLSNLAWLYLDEPHLMSETVFSNAVARARDRRAKIKIGLTSLPKIGWLSRQFQDQHDAERNIIHTKTEQNKYLHPDYIRNLRRACPRQMERAYLHGEFCPQGGSVYGYEFGTGERHVIQWPARPYVHLKTGQQVATDIGVGIDWSPRRPHVLWFQHVPAGVEMPGGWVTQQEIGVVFDEIYPSGEYRPVTVRHLCKMIRERGHPIRWAIVDPAGKAVQATSGESEILQAEKYLNVPILYQHGQRIRVGIQHVQLALDPIDSHPVLWFSKSLVDNMQPPEERSVVNALQGYSYPESKGDKLPDEPVHDDVYSHACDVVRYWVNYYHPVDRLSADRWIAA